MSKLALCIGVFLMAWALIEMIASLVGQRGKTEAEVNRLQGIFVSAAIFGLIGFCMAITLLSYVRVTTETEPLPTIAVIEVPAQQTTTPSR